MKKIHIVALVVIAAVIALLISQLGNFSTYETIASAKAKQGKTVTIIAKLNKQTLQYDPVKNPNYLTFDVSDTTGNIMKVVYYFEKPQDMEKSERIVLKGKMDHNGVFQIRDQTGILLKCPSKYKDNPNALKNDDVLNAKASL
ncbi:MAG: cytochrome c maturation protein CcmE [Arachidicoccus sp.]|nr:cytochrome c maturation protein CcmE [Arachidicoccus sp.]